MFRFGIPAVGSRLLVEFGQLDQYDWSALRLVLFAGEVFPIKHLRALLEKWPKPRYFNLYGPTETNVQLFRIPSEIPEDREDPFRSGRSARTTSAWWWKSTTGQSPPVRRVSS